MPAPRRNRHTEVSEIPRQDPAAPSVSHRHHRRIDQIQSCFGIARDEIEGVAVLGVGRSVEMVHALEEAPPEDDCSLVVPAGSQKQVDLDVDRPWHEGAPAKRAEQSSGELMALALRAIAGGDEWTRVADNQSARRDSTSSTRRDRSGSSSMVPA